MEILNLTEYPATKEQEAQGVVNLPPLEREALKSLLAFNAMPSEELIRTVAGQVAAFAHSNGYGAAMIGGAPFLIAPLEAYLHAFGLKFFILLRV